MRRRSTAGMWQAVALALLMAAALPPHAAGQSPSAAPVWWGPTQPMAGHHVRVPVTVTNDYTFPLTNAPVVAQIDVGEALREAGWVTAPSGERDVLQSFRLDLDSIRVVAMTNLKPPTPGTNDGQLRLVEPALPASDLRRFEVPALAMPGFLESKQANPYNERTNPVVTVVWEVPGVLRPGESRDFMVYLDTTTNLDHARPDHAARATTGRLNTLFGPGAGLELVGSPRVVGSSAQVTVVALNPATTLRVYTATVGGQWKLAAPPSGFPTNPLVIGAGQPTQVYAGPASTALVRIVADKPLIAYGLGTGPVPALDGGYVGRSFMFPKTSANFPDDTIHFVAMGQQPTTVVVQPVPPDGNQFQFTMNDAANPYPYTIGARSAGFPQAPVGNPAACPPLSSFNLLGPGLYTATVTQGSPVQLHHAPTYGLTQVPTTQGRALGTDFWSTMGWSTANPRTSGPAQPTCNPFNRLAWWHAVGIDGPAEVRATSPQLEGQVDPMAPAGGAPVGRDIPAAPLASPAYPAPMRDRPVRFTALEGSIALFTGLEPPQGGAQNPPPRVPILHGPLIGDDAGRRYIGLGPTLVYAPYNNTRVAARLEAALSGPVNETATLSGGAVYAFDDLSPSDWVNGVSISSDRPVIATPRTTSSMFAALPMRPSVQVHLAEFRGHLVRIDSLSGLDPLTGSTAAGGSISYTLTVTNLGRGVDGADLPDTIDLALSDPPTGWSATLSPQTIGPLGSGQDATVTLTVRPQADAPPGSLGIFTVTARSRGNPQMSDTVGTVTYLQRTFDVALWFGTDLTATAGGKTLTRGVEEQGTSFPIVLHNQGSVTDTIQLSLTPPGEGWSVRLLHAGTDVERLTLAADQRVPLELRVRPPAGQANGLLVTTVTADSVSSPAIDRVTATTRMRSPSALDLEAQDEQVHVQPGGTARFRLRLTNPGGATEVDLAATADALPGWQAPDLAFVDPQTGTRIPLARYSLESGGVLPFEVTLPVPARAQAGDVVGIRVSAQSRDGPDAVEAFLHAVVRPVHRLVAGVPATVTAALDANTTVSLRIANEGNLNETLAWRVRGLPAGWTLDGPRAGLLVPRGATQDLRLVLRVPAGEASGLHNVTVDLVSRDGNVTTVPIRVAVGDVVALDVATPPAPVPAQPGRQARVRATVANLGNVPLEVAVEPHPAEPWALAAGSQATYRLAPGERVQVPISWEVPATAADGQAPHRARLVARPDGQAAQAREVAVDFDVGRPDLRVGALRVAAGPAGTLVEAEVHNAGARPADGFTVRLLSQGAVVQDVAVQELAPGRSATVRLMAPAGQDGGLGLLLDADASVVEVDESNNAATPGQLTRAEGAPGPGLALALACVALALAIARAGGMRRRQR